MGLSPDELKDLLNEAAEASGVTNEHWADSGYPPTDVVDWRKKSDHHNHGEEGHIGYRCGQCAREATDTIEITLDTVDYWQAKQLDWQEECDRIQVDFDERSAAHWPEHKAVNCQECPKTIPMPVKPNPPIERALKQIQSES